MKNIVVIFVIFIFFGCSNGAEILIGQIDSRDSQTEQQEIENKLFGTYSDEDFRTFASYNLSDLSDPPLDDIAVLNGIRAIGQGDNTYDAANGRYFVSSGNAIIVVDSNSGAIIANIDNEDVRLMGIEYDQNSNKLFGTYLDGNQRTFASYNLSDLSDPPLDDIAVLNGIQTIGQGDSTYDVANGRYFVSSGNAIIVVDSNSGAIIANIDNEDVRLMGIEYDQSSNKLFGTYSDEDFRTFASYNLSDLSDPPLDDIAVLNGIRAIGQGDSTYDAANGRYFVSSGNAIIVVDSSNGAIIANIDNEDVRLMGIEFH